MTTRTPRSQGTTVHFDSPAQEVYLSLWRTYDRLRMLEDELFTSADLTAQQYNVLRLLRAELPDGLPTLTLANRLVSRAPDITRMIDRLEQRGLTRRERQADNRRVIHIHLTDEGLALLKQLAGPLKECHQRQLGHLSTAQLKQLSELLTLARRPHEETDGHWG